MAATGLKKGGIYRHFASKEELAAAAFDYTWEAAWRVRMLDVNTELTGAEQLKQLIANFVDYRPAVAGGCPILNTATDADDGNPVLRARVSKALRSWLAHLQLIVTEAAKRSELQPGVDPRVVSTLIVATLEGALMISRLERHGKALNDARDHLNRYIDTEVAISR
jgi:TetR/AcrR family transcriptional repressor of nem operon